MHPSSEVSGTVRTATVGEKEFPEADIRIIDTCTVGCPLSTLVEFAAQWSSDGLEADTIMNNLQTLIPHIRIYFVVDTLDYLAKGSFIGGATVLLGSLLKIKPI